MNNVIIFFVLTLFWNFFSTTAHAANLDGTSSLVYQTTPYSPTKNDSVTGYVRLNAGFNAPLRGAVIMDTITSVSGFMWGTEMNSTVTLNGDFKLSSQAKFTNAFDVSGHGNTIILEGDMVLPRDKMFTFRTDTIIDGCGNTLTFTEHSQFLIDNDVTLTLRNMTIQTTRSPFTRPCIRAFNETSRLALDNVVLSLSEDFDFRTGRFFIHNDVRITGTSQFVYRSIKASYITSGALLTFDPNTTLYYYPSSSQKDLIRLVDQTSGLYFNNATLQTTHTGMQLSRGRLWLDNHVTISTRANTTLLGITQKDVDTFGTSVRSVSWSHDNRFLAVGGVGPTNANELQIFSWNGSTLALVTSVDFGATLNTVAWSPSGKFIAIGGFNPTGATGFELQVYRFNGTTLSLIAGQDYVADSATVGVMTIAWHPSEQFIGYAANTAGSNNLRILSFNGATVATLTTISLGGALVGETLAWTSDGTYVAFGDPSTADLKVYSFNGSTLTQITSTDIATARPFCMAFRPDNLFLAVGVQNPSGTGGATNELKIFSWSGSALASVTGADYTSNTASRIESVCWSPDGQYLVIGGQNPNTGTGINNEVKIYSFDGTTLTFLTGFDYGVDNTAIAYSVDWSKDGNFIAVGGISGTAGHDEIEVHQVFYRFNITTQALTNGLIFGRTDQGSTANLSTYILSDARVEVAGSLTDESS